MFDNAPPFFWHEGDRDTEVTVETHQTVQLEIVHGSETQCYNLPEHIKHPYVLVVNTERVPLSQNYLHNRNVSTATPAMPCNTCLALHIEEGHPD